MLDGTPDWMNVDCDGLRRDAARRSAPDPPDFPYEEGGIINCDS